MGTRKLLVVQGTVLVLLVMLAMGLVSWAHHTMHRHPATVRDRTAPAVLKVAAARAALVSAHLAVQESLHRAELAALVGTGEEYRTDISAATQNLSQIADRQVAGEAGERTLSTIIALLTAYTDAIAQAVEHQDDKALSSAHLASADAIINRGETGILFRIDELQKEQRATLTRQTSARWAAWAPALAALLLLAVMLVAVQWQLYRRFPQRFNPWLLAACALLAGAVLPVRWAADTQRQLDDARADLVAVISAQDSIRAVEEWPVERVIPAHDATRVFWQTPDGIQVLEQWQAGRGRKTDRLIPQRSEEVTDGMNAASSRAGWIDAIPVAGIGIAALVGWGLYRHARLYRFRSLGYHQPYQDRRDR